MGFPAGHLDSTRTLPLGVRVRVDLERGRIEFPEAAVE
jgi:muramoyltetrapeptide carboxypeptidase LdcA involved in peptidoglycan recycling